MEFSKNEIIAHLKGQKQANKTMLETWNLDEEKNQKLQVEIDLLNELLFKFDDKTKKPGE